MRRSAARCRPRWRLTYRLDRVCISIVPDSCDPLTEISAWPSDLRFTVRVRPTNGFALVSCESERSLGCGMSSGMSMDVIELVIYGLLAMWGPPLLFAAYLLRPLNELSCNPDHEKQPAGHRDHDGDQIAHLPPHWARCSSFERTRPPGDGDRQTALLVWAGRLGNAGA